MTKINEINQDNLEELSNNEDKNIEEKQYTDFERKAMALGWSPDGKKSAEDWSLDGLSVRNEKITDLYKISENMKELMAKQEKLAYDKARSDLEAERDAAIARGDVKHVKELDAHEKQMQIQADIIKHAQAFRDRNAEWFHGTSHESLKIQKAAREMDNQLAAQQLPPEKHFEALENYLKGEFPEYFGESSKKKTNAVEGSSSTVVRTSSGKREFTFNDLSEEQKKFARLYEKRGVMKIDQYIKEQILAGNLK